ncbi:MAG: polysaccharide deacetylase family protein [Flavobacteriales bacterium]|nr:polysaccharide deacetylase family protein [Flavobacteriales bacterium]MBK7943308.1 polysaccharide deacetylase family protein [Flavobacteriales bacterium]MBK9700003.1 polysaccharide deacetylase family protein [Flavobacteriales bacterium]
MPARPPWPLRALMPGVLWRMDPRERVLYLTFDDGPDPQLTPWVLDQLAAVGAHATFFCRGDRALARPDLVERLRAEGHGVGGHTWDHPDGWRTPLRPYLRNVLRGQREVGGPLFRPPYGRLTPAQLAALKGRLRVVMWDVLSRDYDLRRTAEECLDRTLRLARPGSIIVFHDAPKAADRLRVILPQALERWNAVGYRFASLA